MTTKPKLLIDIEGNIECEEHALRRGVKTDPASHARPMTVGERADFRAEMDRDPECESCRAIASPKAKVNS